MSNAILESEIEAAWNIRDTITPSTKGKVRDAIKETLEALDKGELRVQKRQKIMSGKSINGQKSCSPWVQN